MSDALKESKTKLSKKLADRIKKEIGLEVEPIIRRTYAGRWQRSSGAMSWFMQIILGGRVTGCCVGSAYPATVIAKSGWDVLGSKEHALDSIELIPKGIFL